MKVPANIYKLSRSLRIIISVAVALAVFVAVAFGFDLWLCRWQLVPAVLAGALTWIVLWIAVTAFAGRIYCSSVCPMGTLLDVFARLGHLHKGYFYSQSHVLMRRSLVVITVAALLAGIPVMLDILDPAAAYSRIAAWSVSPLFKAVSFSLSTGIIAFATVAVAAATAWSRGRILCNTVCPVGAILAEVSRFSLYHIDINTDKCVGCGLCTEKCKAECIDPSAHTVDSSRCVVCFDCTTACPNSAITYRRGRHRLVMPMMQAVGPASNAQNMETPDESRPTLDRRKFIATMLTGLPAMLLSADSVNPDYEPLNPVHPPGLRSAEVLKLQCTACGACSAACPSGIIRPAESFRSLRAPLRPVLEFETGACRYDCTRCTHVCPTGALEPLTVGEKHIFVIGKARVVAQFCLEYAAGEGCGECARRCPRRAITIKPVEQPQASPGHPADHLEFTSDGKMRKLPYVASDLCIGCGECRYVCPARPRAFIIEGEQ